MRLRNVLVTVSDVNRAKHFYKELLGLETILDNGCNVMLTEGLVLQEKTLWEQTIGHDIFPYNNASVLYFEERDIEAFVTKLSQSQYSGEIQYLCPLTEIAPGRKVLRFYDPDGNLIEVGTPWR